MMEVNSATNSAVVEVNDKIPRILWPSLQGKRNADNTVSYPFLANENLLDLALIWVLLHETPYKSSHGTKKES